LIWEYIVFLELGSILKLQRIRQTQSAQIFV